MATYSRVKTFVANETLTASDLNAEFNNIITNTNSGNLNSDNVSTSSAWTWTGYHTYSTSSRIALSDDIYMTLGNATDGDYRVRYNATSTALEIMSTDSDGAGTDAVVLDIQDGTDDLRLRGGFSTDNNTAPTSGIVTGGNIVSDTDSTDDLGTTSVRWANLYVDAATITNNLTVGGTLTLTGGLTLNGNVTVGDNASDTLTINSTITSNLLFTDNTYDIGASGATRPRDLHLSRNAVMGGTLGVTGLITATGGVSGALTGNVTGDVTGDLTGNVTGNVTGNLTGDVTGNISGNVTGGTISGTTGTFSDDLTVGTTDLIVDVSANKVGIGAAPTEELDIQGSGATQTIRLIRTDASTAGGITINSANASNSVYNTIAKDLVLSADNGATQTKLHANGDFSVNTSQLFVDQSASRVGINNNSPATPLHVKDASTAYVMAETTGTSTSAGFRLKGDASADYTIFTTQGVGNFGIYDNANTAQRLTIDTSGNMGLGVTPSAWHSSYRALQVNDSVLYNDGAGNTFVGSNFYWDGSNYKYINTDYAPAYGQVSGEHRWYTAASGTAGNNVSFTQAMTLTSAGLLGLGTSSPSSYFADARNLVVASSGNGGVTIKSGTTSTGNIFFANAEASAANNGIIQYDHNTNEFAFNNYGSNQFYSFSIQGSEKLRLDATGLGISTTSPKGLVDIAAAGRNAAGDISDVDDYALVIRCSSTTNEGNGIAFTNDSAQVVGGAIIHQDKGSANTGDLVFYTRDTGGNVDEAMRIDNSQRLIVGTNGVAGDTFNVSNGGAEQLEIGTSSGYANFQSYNRSGSAYIATEFRASEIRFDTGSSPAERLRITSDGDLLIGETTNQIARVYAKTGTVGDYAIYGITTDKNRGPAFFNNTSGTFDSIMLQLYATRAATNGYDFCRFNSGNGADLEFRFRGDGEAYADGAWNGSGADYQEYFESQSGNAAEVGRTIVLDGDRVRYYNAGTDSTDDIMGVTRPQEDNKNSAVVGNTAWNHWTDKYLTDDWGVYLREDVTVWTYTDEEGNEFAVYERDELAKDPNWTPPEGATSSTQSVRKLNPDYDESLDNAYQSREERDEWWLVGLLGQIQVKAGEPVNPRWIKMKNISDAVELYYVR